MAVGGLNNRAGLGGGQRRGGWILVELVVALGILGILLTALGRIQYEAGKLNAIHWMKVRCITAGQGQLDSMAGRGELIDERELERLWPGIRVEVEQSAGEGDWEGLTLVRVKAEGKVKGKAVKVELARYMAGRKEK